MSSSEPIVWIGYTTHYRGGSDKFARAAITLAEEIRAKDPGRRVRVRPLVRKQDFANEMRELHGASDRIDELHFIGHSGMYGIMFGSTRWPEQFSPHEWREMVIPFVENAKAYFHACRTARWFAPFFARTFGVTAYGYWLYTTVSRRKDRFAWEATRLTAGLAENFPLYVIACPGRKSHGLAGSAHKYLLGAKAEAMVECRPRAVEGDPSYDTVAKLYDKAFEDIRVRRDEWRWISEHMPHGEKPRVLDIGCGNGALLRALDGRIGKSVGVDASAGMIERARARSTAFTDLSFQTIDGPRLPFPDGSFDLVTSFLSFRYLDWDPILKEIHRVLSPRGRLLVVDMVAKPLEARDAVTLARSAWVHATRPYLEREFDRNLRALTTHPAWKKMLEYNPIRAEHEYRWFLESRFTGQKLETLTVGRTQRLVAFDSGPKSDAWRLSPMSFP